MFPDRIERSVELAHPPAKVWAALTTSEGLSAWFGDRAAIDLRPGGAAHMTFKSGVTVDMRVERVEADSRRKTYDSHAEGWVSELGELADYLDAV